MTGLHSAGNRVAVAPIVVALRTDWRRSQRKGIAIVDRLFTANSNTVSRCWPSRVVWSYVSREVGVPAIGWRSSIVTNANSSLDDQSVAATFAPGNR